MLVGSPETVANKLIDMIETLNLDRFLLHLPLGQCHTRYYESYKTIW